MVTTNNRGGGDVVHCCVQVMRMYADSVHGFQQCNFSSAGNQLSTNLPFFKEKHLSKEFKHAIQQQINSFFTSSERFLCLLY